MVFELACLLLSRHPEIDGRLHLLVLDCPNPVALSAINRDPFRPRYSNLSPGNFASFLLSEGYFSPCVIQRVLNMFAPSFREDLKLYESFQAVNETPSSLLNLLRNTPVTSFLTKKIASKSSSDYVTSKFSEESIAPSYPLFTYSWESIASLSVSEELVMDEQFPQPFYFVHSEEFHTLIVSTMLEYSKKFLATQMLTAATEKEII